MATAQSGRKPGHVRRREIALAALDIAAAHGVGKLTTANLAAEVGLSTGALFRHFETLAEMLDFAAELALERIAETFPAATDPPLQRVVGLARNRVALFAVEPGMAWLMQSDQAPLLVPPLAVKKLREMAARSKQFLLAALREGIAGGTVRADIPVEHLLVPVVGTIHALIRHPSIRGESDATMTTQTAGAMPPTLPDPVEGALAALSTLLSPPLPPAP